MAQQVNLIRYADLSEERSAVGKIRYKDPGAPCLVRQREDGALKVSFAEQRPAITPGQSVVLYEGEDVLGGGWIEKVWKQGEEEPTSDTEPLALSLL